ncbi:unnamed protein product, partial [Adineta ricciae]
MSNSSIFTIDCPAKGFAQYGRQDLVGRYTEEEHENLVPDNLGLKYDRIDGHLLADDLRKKVVPFDTEWNSAPKPSPEANPMTGDVQCHNSVHRTLRISMPVMNASNPILDLDLMDL